MLQSGRKSHTEEFDDVRKSGIRGTRLLLHRSADYCGISHISLTHTSARARVIKLDLALISFRTRIEANMWELGGVVSWGMTNSGGQTL